MRKNGLETPFHVLQLATWVVFPAVMALFLPFIRPFWTKHWPSCTGTDPSDDDIMRSSTMAHVRDARPDDRVYCNVCMKYVNNKSRHCRLCDKCVDVFDHHCKWLNNCVGRKNYQYFLGSVVGASVFLAVQIAVGIFIVVKLYSNEKDMQGHSATSYGCSTEKDNVTGLCVDGQYRISLQALRIIHIVLLAFLSPWLFMIAQLALFHFHLCMENITTYDYIVRQRKRKNAQHRESKARVPWWKRCCGEKPNSGSVPGNPKTQRQSDKRLARVQRKCAQRGRENGDTTYLAAPYSPGTPSSPVSLRSDAGSAHFSSAQVDENEFNLSLVTYGRRPLTVISPANHIA
ncbi:unnamed protein product [Peronospora destructor]|uniref:Palmitoyltransferase n=1 Tax=Peronospora destructor TaxID=86335 RepID=A0AAV0U3A7_9STRA|nr:unnamed protein product [Peronospora destructor]